MVEDMVNQLDGIQRVLQRAERDFMGQRDRAKQARILAAALERIAHLATNKRTGVASSDG